MIAPYWLGVIPLLLGSFLPGYLLSVTWGKEWADGLDFWGCLFVPLLSGLILNSWLLLFLAELEAFSLPAILVGWIAICAPLAWMGRHRWREHAFPRPKWSWPAILLLVLLVLAGVLFAHPAESFLVLDDSGIYVLGGIHLAKTGSLFATDSILASFSPQIAKELLFTGPATANWTRLWGQFFVWNWNRPWVSFGLLHMQRLWCALFTLFLGTYGGLWVAPTFGLVATIGVYLLGRRLFSRGVGLLGAMLLTLNFVQIWHARYPLSEMLAQALAMGGFYLLALGAQKRHVWLNVLAGLCLGGLFLVRVDAILFGIVLLGLVLYWRLSGQWRKDRAAFGLALGFALAYATLHNVAWGWAYFTSLWQTTGSPALTKILLIGSWCLVGIVWIVTFKPRLGTALSAWLSAHMHQATVLIAAVLVILSALGLASSRSSWTGHGIIWLAQYWTPLGLCLAAGGLSLAFFRRPTQLVLPFLVTALVYFVLFSLFPFVNPVQPWAMRRFVPIVMPALALLTAYAITMLPALPFQLQRLVQALAVFALVITFVRTDQPFLSYAEYEGMGKQIQEFAEQFEDGAVILFDQGNSSLFISQPLAYIYNLNTFVLQKPSPDSSIINSLLKDWQQHNTPVYLVLSGGALDWHPPEWAFIPDGTFSLHITRIRRSPSQPPTDIEHMNPVLDIYRVVPSAVGGQGIKPTTRVLDMEAGEYPYTAGGFYGFETTAEGLTYRWTSGLARVQLPHPDGTAPLLHLRVAGGRPDGVEDAHLSILVGGAAVAQAHLLSGFTFQTLEITLPPNLVDTEANSITIELQSNTWVPAASGHSGDLRELGIVVDWIGWQPGEVSQ